MSDSVGLWLFCESESLLKTYNLQTLQVQHLTMAAVLIRLQYGRELLIFAKETRSTNPV